MAKLILIIEDDDNIALELEAMLRHNGYQVEVCADGQSGMNSLREYRPNLVLLDTSMRAGVEPQVGADPELKTIPIVDLQKPVEARKVALEVIRTIGPAPLGDFDDWEPVVA